MKILSETRDALQRKAKVRFAALVRRAISAVDDVVFARRQIAYAYDDFGVHANPSAPRRVRFAMCVLSRLIRIRDAEAPCWDRRPGAHPHRYVGA